MLSFCEGIKNFNSSICKLSSSRLDRKSESGCSLFFKSSTVVRLELLLLLCDKGSLIGQMTGELNDGCKLDVSHTAVGNRAAFFVFLKTCTACNYLTDHLLCYTFNRATHVRFFVLACLKPWQIFLQYICFQDFLNFFIFRNGRSRV